MIVEPRQMEPLPGFPFSVDNLQPAALDKSWSMVDFRTMKKQLRISLLAVHACLATAAMAQCSTSLPTDSVTLFYGYGPMACATLTPVVTGTAPFTFAWSNGATDPSITICDQGSSVYYVTVTDADGCVSSDTVFVHVIDVRCGNNLQKVAVCHIPPGNPANAHTICISENGVPAHLAHGCHLGACAADTMDTGEMQMYVSPNPMSEDAQVVVTARERQEVIVTVVDAMGRTSMVVFAGTIEAGTTKQWSLVGSELDVDLFWVRCSSTSGTRLSQQIIRVK
jgi:hypothetical protein